MTFSSVGRVGVRPVVTMWETFGSHMIPIGQRVSQFLQVPLHYGVVAPESIVRAYLATSADHDDWDGDWIDALLGYLRRRACGDQSARLSAEQMQSYRDAIAANTRLVRQHALEGGVFLGRNATCILHDLPSAVHVLCDAPIGQRCNAVAQEEHLDLQTVALRQAAEDEMRVLMSKDAYGYDPSLPDNYDVVLNTAEISIDEAAATIVDAVTTLLGDQGTQLGSVRSTLHALAS